jgi:alpha-1,2-mannosyltransferase
MTRADVTVQVPLRRWTIAALLVCAVASTVLVLTTVDPFLARAGILAGGDDFETYRDAADHVTGHIPLYSEKLIHDHLYTYTPFSALTFLPLEWLPHGWAGVYTWLVVNFVVLAAIVVQCWRMLGYEVTRYVIAASALIALTCTFLEPVRATLFYGQINLVLLLLVLWDTGRPTQNRLRGLGVGIAAGIKLTPAYFIFYFLTVRQWRSAAVALGTVLASVAVGWAVLPSDSQQYWAGMLFDTQRIGKDLLHPSNQSLRGAMARLAGAPPTSVTKPLPGEAPPNWLWLLAAVAVVAVSAVIAVLLFRCGERLLSVTITGLTAVVVSPFSWSHHWVWFVPLVVWVLHRALTNRWWWLCAVTLLLILGAWPYQFPVDKEPRIGFYMFPGTWVNWDVVSNLYLLLYAAVLAGAAVVAIQSTRKQQRHKTIGAELPD